MRLRWPILLILPHLATAAKSGGDGLGGLWVPLVLVIFFLILVIAIAVAFVAIVPNRTTQTLTKSIARQNNNMLDCDGDIELGEDPDVLRLMRSEKLF